MDGLFIFFIGMGIGAICEIAFNSALSAIFHKNLRITHRFTLAKKINFITLPIWGTLFLLFLKSNTYVFVFVASALIGTFLEGTMGMMTSRFYGMKLWTYKHGAIGNFTSIYSIPYWGAAGVIFASIGKVLGL